jgi:hypothetical protein
MHRRKRKIFLAAMIGLIGVMILVWIRFAPPPTYNLVNRATKVTNVSRAGATDWFTSDELLLQTPDHAVDYTRPTAWSGYFELINAQTGSRTRLEGLSKAVREHASFYDLSVGPLGFTQSPDGQWLLSENLIMAGHPTPVTVHRDGSGYHVWKPDEDHNRIDGHRWVSFFYPRERSSEGTAPERLIVHDAAHLEAGRVLAATSPEAQAITDHATMPSSAKQNAALVAGAVVKKPSNLEVRIYSVPFGVRRIKRPAPIGIITLPLGTDIKSDDPNAQNTRIAFLLSETGIPTYATLLHRFLPNYHYKAHPVECLCVYRADTNTFVEIGRIDEPRATEPDLLYLSWLPDGKHIQFFYKDAVYRVSTD